MTASIYGIFPRDPQGGTLCAKRRRTSAVFGRSEMLRWMQKSEALLAPGLLAVLTVAVAGPAGAGEAGEAAGGAPVPELIQPTASSQDALAQCNLDAVPGGATVSQLTPEAVPPAPERPSRWRSGLASASMSRRRDDPGPWAAPGSSEAPPSRAAVVQRVR